MWSLQLILCIDTVTMHHYDSDDPSPCWRWWSWLGWCQCCCRSSTQRLETAALFLDGVTSCDCVYIARIASIWTRMILYSLETIDLTWNLQRLRKKVTFSWTKSWTWWLKLLLHPKVQENLNNICHLRDPLRSRASRVISSFKFTEMPLSCQRWVIAQWTIQLGLHYKRETQCEKCRFAYSATGAAWTEGLARRAAWARRARAASLAQGRHFFNFLKRRFNEFDKTIFLYRPCDDSSLKTWKAENASSMFCPSRPAAVAGGGGKSPTQSPVTIAALECPKKKRALILLAF